MLSEEEKKPIELIKEDIEVYKEKGVWKENSIFIKSLRTILNLIEKQQAEIENKNKIIYEIAKAFKQDDIRSIDEIIEYFTNKVERNNK